MCLPSSLFDHHSIQFLVLLLPPFETPIPGALPPESKSTLSLFNLASFLSNLLFLLPSLESTSHPLIHPRSIHQIDTLRTSRRPQQPYLLTQSHQSLSSSSLPSLPWQYPLSERTNHKCHSAFTKPNAGCKIHSDLSSLPSSTSQVLPSPRKDETFPLF